MVLKYYLPTVIWFLFIFILLAMPTNDVPKFHFLKWLYADKLVHIFIFTIFSFLLIRSFEIQDRLVFFSQYSVWISLSVSIAYGITMEFLQGWIFISRTFDWYDILTNILGSISGIPLARKIKFY